MREIGTDSALGRLRTDRLYMLNGQTIGLALDEAYEDSRPARIASLACLETVSGDELMAFHRQLFMWRLLKEHSPFRQALFEEAELRPGITPEPQVRN